jgi:hypothetical protein
MVALLVVAMVLLQPVLAVAAFVVLPVAFLVALVVAPAGPYPDLFIR